MTNEQKPNETLDKYFQHVIHCIASSDKGIMLRSEIAAKMKKNKICENRQVSKILKHMVDMKYLARKKVLGSKRIGYVINEEIIGLGGESFVIGGFTKTGKIIFNTVTQTALNQRIKATFKKYRKTIGNKKSDINNDDEIFYIAHTLLITFMLSWISRLHLTIHGGVFRGKVTKTNLARENIKLIEKFLDTLCHNFREKFPNEKYNQALSEIVIFFETLDMFPRTKYSRRLIEPFSLIH